jgi:hypothetical protein
MTRSSAKDWANRDSKTEFEERQDVAACPPCAARSLRETAVDS